MSKPFSFSQFSSLLCSTALQSVLTTLEILSGCHLREGQFCKRIYGKMIYFVSNWVVLGFNLCMFPERACLLLCIGQAIKLPLDLGGKLTPKDTLDSWKRSHWSQGNVHATTPTHTPHFHYTSIQK